MRSSRIFLVGGLVILLVAAWLRLWQLATYPPGPHYDEAVYFTIARSIAFGGARPFPIVEAYQGREVLYMYLSGALLPLLGDRVFTLQLTSAFLNLLTVAAGLALGRAMFGGRRGALVGLVMGAALALSFPQILLARQAFRAVSLPFCQALALLFLWRGLQARRGDWRWLLAGGVFAGLALYTYMASRLFPFWLLLGGLALLLLDRANWRRRIRQGVLFFGALALIGLPLGLYALEKPDIFLGRLDEVTQTDDALTLSESILVHARMFFIEGDPYLRYNIPGRPYTTPLEGALLLLGMGVALWRLVGWQTPQERTRQASSLQGFAPTERAAYALALLAPLMVLPSVISVGGLPPNHMRSGGMIPLIFVLVGVGAEWLWARASAAARMMLARRRTTQASSLRQTQGHRGEALPRLNEGAAGRTTQASSLLIVGVIVGGALMTRTYFEWAGRADLYYETHADLSAAARWLPGAVAADTLVYIGTPDRQHPTMTIEQTPPLRWLGTDTLFLPPPGKNALYIFPHSSPPPGAWADILNPVTDGLPLAPDGRPAFLAYRFSDETALTTAAYNPNEGVIDNAVIAFVAMQPVRIAAGDHARVTLVWRVEQPPSAPDLRPLVQLEDSVGNVLYRGDVYMDETNRWQTGERLLQRVDVRVPEGTPPGNYPLRVAWAARRSDLYLPFDGGQVWLDAGDIPVTRPDEFPDALPMQIERAISLAPGVTLLGWNPAPEQARPGESLPLTLFWRAAGDERAAFTMTALLRAADGAATTLWTGEPIGGYTADQWQMGELLAERVRWAIPREQPAGGYQLVLQTTAAEISLGQVEVAGLPRIFEPPPVATVVEANFGAALQLYGYSAEVDAGTIRLTLVWRARAEVAQDYTVFVHVVDEQGAIIAQRDVMPRDGTYPTSLWLTGEYITDEHHFTDMPALACNLHIGLYSQQSGERLPLVQGDESLTKDYIHIDACKV